MLGPHHLNEVFLDDVWVTEADVLGEVDQGWKVVLEVLAFERVGIARYARVERLLQWAPAALGDAWDRLPDELRGRWARMLVHARRARLLAYRVIATQETGQVRPGDTAAYRIAVTRLDQESAEVLLEIAAELPASDRARCPPVPAGGRGPPPLLGVGHDGVGQHRDAADPAGPDPAGGGVNTDLSPEAVEYGDTARRALEAAGGDTLAAAAPGAAGDDGGAAAKVLADLGAWDLDPRGSADELEAAAALCRSAGWWGLAHPVAERVARPRDVEADAAGGRRR